MRSRNIELKSDLANLFKDLEEAKRESPNVVPISKPKIDQSDIKNLFSGLEEASKQARVVEKKRKDYVETTPADISNLLKELEEASKQAKNEEPRIPRKKGQPAGSDKHSDLYTDENPKGTIHGLKFATVKDAKASVKKIDNSGKTHAHKVQAAVAMEQRAKEMGKTAEASVYRSYIEKMKKITKEKSKKEETIKLEALESVLTKLVDNTPKDIEEEVELVNKLDDTPKPIEVKEEVNFVNDTITHLDDKKKKVDIKEEINDVTTLRKEFDNFRSFVGQQLASSQMSGAGSGEVRLEFLDDVQRTTAKVDGKFLKYSSSAGQFIGADATDDETIQDIVGNMVSSNTESGITVTYQDADGTLDFTIGTLNQDTTGNAATATALETGRTINGTSFDGTANITVTSAAGTLTGNTLNSGVIASSLTSVGTLTLLTVDNVSINGATIGHTDDTDLITLSDGAVTIAGNLTVSGTTTTVNQTVVNVTDAFVFEGANADAHETTFRVDEPTADRKASLQDKTGTIALLSGFKLNATDGSASNDGDFLVLDTSADENDRLLFEDGTTDPLSVLASHGITLVGQGWNAFQFDNT